VIVAIFTNMIFNFILFKARTVADARGCERYIKFVRKLIVHGMDEKVVLSKFSFDGTEPERDWTVELERFVVHCLEGMHRSMLLLDPRTQFCVQHCSIAR